ncbi:hypothetical protein PG995_004541 [Apiospora arundinis]
MSIARSDYVSSIWKGGIFNERVVFCTGGAGTICSAQVRALVCLGANACIIGRNTDKALSMAKSLATARPGAQVIGIGGVDVRKLTSLEAAASQCVEKLGRLDYVINSLADTRAADSAGAAGNFLAPIDGLSANAFKAVVDIDLLGMPFQAHVASAKAGVDALSAAIALEYGPRGVTSNVISPGPIRDTEGMERLSSKETRDSGQAARATPLGRYGQVKDIADATIYLLAESGNYMNGHVMVIDGGAWRLS